MKAAPFLLLTTILLIAAPAARAGGGSGENAAWCGTRPSGILVSRARHELLARRTERLRRSGELPRKSAPHVYQQGQVAVIEDDGTLASPPNPFDLQGRAIQYLRRPKGLAAVRSKLGFKALIGTRLELGDRDAVEVEFPEGFRFPFGDEVYSSVYVNSDGNLTFGERDGGFRIDDLGRFLNGPPRIAALMTDLDPAAAGGGGGVYLNFLPGRVRVTYYRVPSAGTRNLNSVQVTLFTTGRVVVVFGEKVDADHAVVGVAPFADGPLHLMDYDEELPFRPRRVILAEQFTEEPFLDDLAVATTFFEHFDDVYSHVFVWLAFPQRLVFPQVLAFHLPARNDVRGIGRHHLQGREAFDYTRWFGSPGRLESYVQMGSVGKYPRDPDEVFSGAASVMRILAHEFGHRWLSYVHVRGRGGGAGPELLRSDEVHWSFLLHSEGSVMFGSDLVDNGDGSFTTSAATMSRFGSLDLYLMGLLPPEEVPDFFYVTDSFAAGRDTSSEVGRTFRGTRVDAGIADVIAVEGPRIPASARAPERFRTAFVVVGRGEAVPRETIDRVDRYRRRWIRFIREATNGLATVGTGLAAK